MQSYTHIPLHFRSPARSCLLAILVVAMACTANAHAVEPVPFLRAIEDEIAAESPDESPAEGSATDAGTVPQEAPRPQSPAELPEDIQQETSEGGAEDKPDPASPVERVAFESRLMQFPDDGGSDAGSVLVEPLAVPEIVGNDYDGNKIVESVEGIPGESMLIEEPALAEMPVLASSGKWFSSGFWYASAESLWYERSRNKRVTIGIEERLPIIQFTTLAQPFDTSPGFRATFGRSLGRDYLDRDRLIEFTYTGALLWQGVDGWNSVTAEPTLLSPLGFNVPGFNFANTYRTSLDSNFNSIEVNFRLRRRLGRDQLVMSPNGGWSRHAERGFLPGLILGPRLARVDEDFWFRSRRNGVDPSVFSGDYDITTQNWLLGMNIGGELVSQNEFYFWGLRGKAAPALTFASAQQTVVGINKTNDPPNPIVPSPVFREDRNTQTSPGFIGDLTLFAGWNVTPNFSLKVGYDFLWVAGIATATRQFNLDDLRQNPMDAGGQTFYNGVSFGLEGSW